MLEERIVAFVDILGSREAVKRMEEGDDSKAKVILKALSIIRNFAQSASVAKGPIADVEVSWFSDSIVISAEVLELWRVIHAVGILSSLLCHEGIYTRGGIARGLCHHSEGICFGPGLIAAYDLESKVAVYPRVVIQQRLADDEDKQDTKKKLMKIIRLGPASNFNFRRSEDGLLWVDILSPNLVSYISFGDGHHKNYVDYMNDVKKALELKLGKNKDERINAKVNWFATYFNRCAMEATSEGIKISQIEAGGVVHWYS